MVPVPVDVLHLGAEVVVKICVDVPGQEKHAYERNKDVYGLTKLLIVEK